MSLEIPKSKVAVHDAVVVRDADCRQQLLHKVHRHVDAEAPVLVEPRAHGAPFDPFHDDEKNWAVLIEVVNADDARMVEGGDGRRLAVKPLAKAGVARVLLGEHFDGDRNLEARVRRPIHHAHGTAPELCLNWILAELCGTHPWPSEQSVCRTLLRQLERKLRPGPRNR
jgi:hypothetical protein